MLRSCVVLFSALGALGLPGGHPHVEQQAQQQAKHQQQVQQQQVQQGQQQQQAQQQQAQQQAQQAVLRLLKARRSAYLEVVCT